MSSAHLKKCLREVETALAALPPAGSAQKHFEYIGGRRSGLQFLGLKVPQVDQVFKAGFSFSKLASAAERLEVWDFIWHQSECYEAMSIPLAYYYDKKRSTELKAAWPKLKAWVGRIDNWAHSDGLSGIYARLLEVENKLVLPTLQKWSGSKNPWERRQSIVSLIYYSTLRQRVLPFKTVAAMVKLQIHHPEMYVQKGVGWTLRELGNAYPEPTLAFLEKHVEDLSAIAFSAATEKLPPAAKAKLKARRLAARQRRVGSK